MGPPKKAGGGGGGGGRTISQAAFDELVKENMEDLGMDPTEALDDAIHTLSLQGVDLSGIVKLVPGDATAMDDPVVQCVEELKSLSGSDGVGEIFRKLLDSLKSAPAEAPAIAVKKGAIGLVCSACSGLALPGHEEALAAGLNALALLLYDLQGTEMFRSCGGHEMVVRVLKEGSGSESACESVLDGGFAVVATAATGNEVVKELFMELKIDELILSVLKRDGAGKVKSVYEAIRVLLTPDDNRVVASQVYGYARRFAKIGVAEVLVESMKTELTSASLVSASIALKAVAVNDEICKSIAQSGGIDAILRSIDVSGEQGSSTVARTCCSLLSKLAGSDANKTAIIEKGGLNRLIQLSARFSDEPSVVAEVMSIITVICLRAPDNAALAIEAGAGDLVLQAMEKFPYVQQLQKSSCLMIRNLVVRNPENRTLLLNHGAEKLIRKAKETHGPCREAATDALRDLGLDDYNR